jgi:hypothetical protein
MKWIPAIIEDRISFKETSEDYNCPKYYFPEYEIRPIHRDRAEKEKSSKPVELLHIERIIEKTKKLLDLPASWDGEGAKKISPLIYQRFASFLENYSTYLLEKNYILQEPEVFPSKDGSLVLEWIFDDTNIVIKIDNSQKEVAYYYFDKVIANNKKIDSNGEIPTNYLSDEIATWLQNASKMAN